jgi:hypothetical protein
MVTAIKKFPPPSKSAAKKEIERLRRENARLKKRNNLNPNKSPKDLNPRSHHHPNQAPQVLVSLFPNSVTIVTNDHVVRQCA